MTSYPARQPFHAHKLTRLLFKGCAAQSIGHHAVCLVIHIAHTEDAARYQGPVRFWNSQLMEVLGFKSPKQLNNARDAAVTAGWLVYERVNIRSVGHYWTTAPESVAKFDDSPIEPIHSDNGNLSESGTNSELIHSESGTRSGTNSGTNSGKLSNPIPFPNPISSSQLRFDGDDLDFAKMMFGKIRGVVPKLKEPKFPKWANDVRLMRERDEHTLAEIKSVFLWANADTFWSTNIQSPQKLREKFPTLHARMGSSPIAPSPKSAADKRAPSVDQLAAMPATPRKAGPQ